MALQVCSVLQVGGVAWVPCSARLVAAGTTLQNTGIVRVYSLGRDLAKSRDIQREFGVQISIRPSPQHLST